MTLQVHFSSPVVSISCLCLDIEDSINFRNRTQKRVTALNRDLPPRNEQFLVDFEQLQNQFPVSFECEM